MPGNSKGTIEFDPVLIYDEANGSLLVLQIENQSGSPRIIEQVKDIPCSMLFLCCRLVCLSLCIPR